MVIGLRVHCMHSSGGAVQRCHQCKDSGDDYSQNMGQSYGKGEGEGEGQGQG